MTDLEETVDSLRDGDKVRARFDYQQVADPFTVTFEGVVRIHETGARVGTRGLVNDSTLSAVEILERAKQPFYTNSDREPRIGDVGVQPANGVTYVNIGDWWVARHTGGYSDDYSATIQRFPSGYLALVDPSELESA